MKFLKLTSLLAFLLLFFSCSSDDTGNGPAIEVLNSRIASIDFPEDQSLLNVYSDVAFEYDDQNRITKITPIVPGPIYGISYPSADIIELEVLEGFLTNANVTSKSIVKLQNDKVQHIVTDVFFESVDGAIERVSKDSTVFSYQNNYISSMKSYRKIATNMPLPETYSLVSDIEYLVENGNIVETISNISMMNLDGEIYEEFVKTSTYTYDNTAQIPFGNVIYEGIVYLGYGFDFILKDKMGQQNTNNIMSVASSYATDFDYDAYETINFERTIDETTGNLQEIVMSGTITPGTILSHPDFVPTFTNKKIKFNYEPMN